MKIDKNTEPQIPTGLLSRLMTPDPEQLSSTELIYLFGVSEQFEKTETNIKAPDQPLPGH